ncbi:MAG: circadian clock protein KaiA [Cyanobacteria bacterium CRU_2_1]|nr:circadian clock protein KaiA [Cyanobacteria bacterium RU_5_0]NJR59767.1 circadian clock protein KaiA [Cyanobacteria bacterium CRU_2_1]
MAQLLSQILSDPPATEKSGRYTLNQFDSPQELLEFVQENQPIDCLVLQDAPELQSLLDQLQQQSMFFPVVIVQPNPTVSIVGHPASRFSYHPAILEISAKHLSQINSVIDQAIGKFIQLVPVNPSTDASQAPVALVEQPATHQSLMAQQARLAKKLKERLGYLGVYYKRNPQHFLRHMTQPQREELLKQLKEEYREIILFYFSDETNLNQRIDNFVNLAFFADVPVSQIVEIHMELMDGFSKQLKLEGRSDEILQDYRLTLIDTIAHLCEMYRRSIPRES